MIEYFSEKRRFSADFVDKNFRKKYILLRNQDNYTLSKLGIFPYDFSGVDKRWWRL